MSTLAERRASIAERMAPRLVEEFGDRALTQAEIAALFGLSLPTVSNTVRLLRERRQLYIADYRLSDKSATAVYKVGDLPDAEKPARNSLVLADTGRRVLELLQGGDKSTKEIMLALRLNRMRVHDVMTYLRETSQVHVCGLTDGVPANIYRVGAGQDFQRAPNTEAPRRRHTPPPQPDPLMAAFFGRAA